MNIIQLTGHIVLTQLRRLGSLSLFILNTLYHMVHPPFYGKQFLKQLKYVGFRSLPVVGLTAIFTGMVLALQSYTGFSRFSAEGAIATVVILSITRELGPVLTGLMVAGRASASIAAEIGTMRVSEQIDALHTLSTDAFKFLIVPRVLAGTIVLPLLVLCADAVGTYGGYLLSVYKLGFNSSLYIEQTFRFLELEDVMSGLVKACIFGFVITIFGCYYGYNTTGGAQGVGQSTTKAVVSSSINILILNYILTALLFAR